MVMGEMDFFEGDELKYVVVFVTAANAEQGMEIARALVAEEVVACVNVVERVRSVFRWKGKVEEENEALLVIKTRTERVPEVLARVKALHSYDVPEIIALPIIDGNPSYLQWIDEVT
jgi:periplasmic divalent cation tolerance protein